MKLRYDSSEGTMIVSCPHDLQEGPWDFCVIEKYNIANASISLPTKYARAMAEEILRLTEPDGD